MTIRQLTGALALTSFLLAAAMPAEAREGPYLYVQAGEAVAHNACQSWWITTVLPSLGSGAGCSERSAIFRGGFGYTYTDTWALELNYGTFGNARSDGTAMFPGFATSSNYSWQLKADGLAVQGVGTFHLGDSVAVIAKAGLARIRFTEYVYSWNTNMPAGVSNYYWMPVIQKNVLAPALGAGFRFDVGPHGSIFLIGETFGSHQIYSAYGSSTRVTLVAASAGLMYRY